MVGAHGGCGLCLSSPQIVQPGPLGRAVACWGRVPLLCAEFNCPWLGRRGRYCPGGMIRDRPAGIQVREEEPAPGKGQSLHTRVHPAHYPWPRTPLWMAGGPVGRLFPQRHGLFQRAEMSFLNGRLKSSLGWGLGD